MDHPEMLRRFATLTTAHLADACLRAQVPVRCARLYPVVAGSRLVGRVAPARHAGSVDIFLEALESAAPGDVLVVDQIRAGVTLRRQVRFDAYLARRGHRGVRTPKGNP
jgi:regulator of RNase E activity RraA